MTVGEMVFKVLFKQDEKSQSDVLSAVKSLRSSITKILGTIGITLSLKGMNELIEEWNAVNKVVNTLNSNLEDQYAIQNDILEAANNCRLAYTDMANYVTNLVKAGSSFFTTTEDAADFLETANQLFQVSGATSSEISSLNSAITSTFTTGKLSAGNFSTVLSACPEVVEYLSETLGISTQNVKALGYAGEITAKQLYAALTGAADEISDAYSGLSLTISDAITIIKNKWGTWLSQLDQTYQITDRIANLMISAFNKVTAVLDKVAAAFAKLSDFLGSDEAALKAVATVIIAIIGALSTTKLQNIAKSLQSFVSIFSKLKTGVGEFFAALKSGTSVAKAFSSAIGNWKLLLIAAAITAIVLAIRDLIKFVKGEDSITGNLFEKLGIDSDAFKESLENLGSVLSQIFSVFQDFISGILPTLKSLWESAEGSISRIVQVLVNLLTIVVNIIAKISEVLLPVIELLLDILDPIIEVVAWLAELLVDGLAASFEFVEDIINGVINGTLKPFVDFLKQVINFIKAVFSGDWEDIWKSIGNIFISIVNGMISSVESFINILVDGINGLSSGFSWLWEKFGMDEAPQLSRVSFTRVAYLAEGGYVDANHPTPVVIGDNTQEGEIVSPISKMRDTVLDALKVFDADDGNTALDYNDARNLITDALAYFGNGSQAPASNMAAQTLENQINNRTVNQSVYMYNTFEGSKDVQKTASAAMRTSATDLTEALANAIYYTR